MTSRANLDMDIALGRARLKCVAARACYLCGLIFRMNASFHVATPVKSERARFILRYTPVGKNFFGLFDHADKIERLEIICKAVTRENH